MSRSSPKVPLAPVSGGRLPAFGTLLGDTLNEMMENLGAYAVVGAVHFGIVLVVILIALLIAYLVMFGVFALGLFGGVGGGTALTEAGAPEALATLVGVGGPVLGAFGGVVGSFLVIGPAFLLLAPMNASILRAVAAHQRGERPLDLGAAFGTLTRDLLSVVLVVAGYGVLVFLGLLFCYLPAFLPMFLLAFASTLVILHRRGAATALSTAARHALAHPKWHGTYLLVTVGLGMVAGQVPVLGPMFLFALHARAHRELFGDGPEPVVEVG